jgi:CRISPR/Cas system-associated exonuclease Cas4 (RecB family)
MTLPVGFQFSQGSLQDYVDCPRRFQLRHVRRVAWPALETEPALENERYLRQGAAFHRLVHQHLIGIPTERLSRALTDDNLRRWWRSYLESGPSDLPPSRYPEMLVSAPVAGCRLVAKYDLVAVDAGRRAIIVDWKTARRRPRRTWLSARMQTRVYPYLLVAAGAHLNGGQPFEAGQVEMIYWFANYPADPEHLAYQTAQYETDGEYLASLIEEIRNLGEEDWPLTTQEKRCTYCPYRSLCERGDRAGTFDEMDLESEMADEFDPSAGLEIDFEQIAEIEY